MEAQLCNVRANVSKKMKIFMHFRAQNKINFTLNKMQLLAGEYL